MTADEILEALQNLEECIIESCTIHPATSLGLDPRCGDLYVNEEYLATRHRRNLEYYGGFEYIDPEDIFIVGNLTLYSVNSDRVLAAIMTLGHNHD